MAKIVVRVDFILDTDNFSYTRGKTETQALEYAESYIQELLIDTIKTDHVEDWKVTSTEALS